MNLTTELLKQNSRIDSRTFTTPLSLTRTEYPQTTILSSSSSLIFISHQKYTAVPEIPHTGNIRISGNNEKLTKYLRKIYKNAADIDSLSIEYNKLCYIIQIEVCVAFTDHFPISSVVNSINIILTNEKCLFYEPRCFFMTDVIDPVIGEEGSEMLVVFCERDVVFVERKGECRFENVMDGINICKGLME